MPASTPQSDGATIIAVSIAVAVVIILVFIILGFVFIVVLFKRRKRNLEINKLQNVRIEKEYIKMKAVTIGKKASSPQDLLYSQIPCSVKWNPTLCTRVLTTAMIPPSTTNVPQGTSYF